LARLWRAFWHDPMADYQRAKELLERRLASPENSSEAEKPKLRRLR
jgi:hypothetical protein